MFAVFFLFEFHVSCMLFVGMRFIPNTLVLNFFGPFAIVAAPPTTTNNVRYGGRVLLIAWRYKDCFNIDCARSNGIRKQDEDVDYPNQFCRLPFNCSQQIHALIIFRLYQYIFM